MREKYESLSLTVLKDLAKARGIKGLTGLKKEQVVELMLAEDEKDKAKDTPAAPTEKKNVTYTYTVRAVNGKYMSSYNSKGITIKDKYWGAKWSKQKLTE